MHHRHPLRPSLALAVAIATAGALGLVAAQPAAASPTYHDQWPGKVVIDYKAPTGVITPNLQNLLAYDNAQPPPQPPPPLSSTFNKALAQNTPTICATIEQQFQQEANSSGDGPLSNWTCSLPDSGDLQATQLASNEVGLNYIVPGTTISF
ncbi:MAG: hypothetical protein JOY89_24610, partial [Solirubrobacterales bacterium]|nr:hypothetical protein [Solirubrobacterales bacterium]